MGAGGGFQEEEDFLLEGIDLAEGNIRILDDINFARFAVFVDAQNTRGSALGISFAQNPLALEHNRQDVTGVFGVILVVFDHPAQNILGLLAFYRLRFVATRCRVESSP